VPTCTPKANSNLGHYPKLFTRDYVDGHIMLLSEPGGWADMLQRKISLPFALERPDYRADIDGLRAIAVAAVVLFHAFPELCPGGFIGVDVFFVISGYLISRLIFENLELGSFTLAGFYLRRIRRIFPALAVTLAAVLATGTIVLLNDEYQQLGKHIAAASSFVVNLALWEESGYFDNSAVTKPLLHLWSLGVEEQFYIIWPLLLLIGWWRGWNLFWIALTLAVISFSLNVGGVHNHPSATFYLPVTRFWELMIGAVLAFAALPKLVPTARNAVAAVGAGLIGIGFVTINDENFPGWWALLPTLGTAFLIAAGDRAGLNRSILSNRVLVSIGLISYPLYLWHWPLFSFARIIEGEAPTPATATILILASIVLAWLTYRYVEAPIRQAPRLGRTVAVLCISLLLIGCAGYIVFRLNNISRPFPRLLNEANAQFVGPLWKYMTNDICLHRYPFKEADGYAWWFCIQSRNTGPTVLLLGDSFANALYPGFAHNDALKAQTILSIGDCGPGEPLNIAVYNPCSGQRRFDQQQFINNIIAAERSLKYVIMNNSDQPNDAYIADILGRIEFVEQHGATAIIFTPQLELPYDIKSCVPRVLGYAAHSCDADVSERAKLDRALIPLIHQLKSRHPEALVFDQNELFCDGTKCSMMHQGIPLLRDEYRHLSEYGSTLLASLFVQWAAANAPGILKK
jgi:peptidoglycan/LPS O-acetylase OafA/YrhL